MEKGRSRSTVTADAYGPTNSGIRRSLASRPPYRTGFEVSQGERMAPGDDTEASKPSYETRRMHKNWGGLEVSPVHRSEKCGRPSARPISLDERIPLGGSGSLVRAASPCHNGSRSSRSAHRSDPAP